MSLIELRVLEFSSRVRVVLPKEALMLLEKWHGTYYANFPNFIRDEIKRMCSHKKIYKIRQEEFARLEGHVYLFDELSSKKKYEKHISTAATLNRSRFKKNKKQPLRKGVVGLFFTSAQFLTNITLAISMFYALFAFFIFLTSLDYDSSTKTVLEFNKVKEMKTISHTILSMVEVPEQLSWFKNYFSEGKVEETGEEDFDLFEMVKDIAFGNPYLYLEEINKLYEYRYELYDEINQWEEALKTGHFQPNTDSHSITLQALKGVNLGDILPVLNPTDSGKHANLSDEQMNELYQMLLISEKTATIMARKGPYSNRHGFGKDRQLKFPINFAMIDSYRQQANHHPTVNTDTVKVTASYVYIFSWMTAHILKSNKLGLLFSLLKGKKNVDYNASSPNGDFLGSSFIKTVLRNWFHVTDGREDSILSVLSYMLFKYQTTNPLDAQIKRDVAATFSIFIMMGIPMIHEVSRLAKFIKALLMNGTELNKLHEYNSGPMGLRAGHNENRHNFYVSLKEVMQTPEFISMSIYDALVMIPATLTLMCATLETEQTYYYLRYAKEMNEGSQLHAMGGSINYVYFCSMLYYDLLNYIENYLGIQQNRGFWNPEWLPYGMTFLFAYNCFISTGFTEDTSIININPDWRFSASTWFEFPFILFFCAKLKDMGFTLVKDKWEKINRPKIPSIRNAMRSILLNKSKQENDTVLRKKR